MNKTIIAAGGSGIRMNAGKNKIFLKLAGKPIILWTIEKFESHQEIYEIILVTRNEDIEELKQLTSSLNKVSTVVPGGNKRQDSVYNGLKAIDAADEDIILIHNAANPLVDEKTITACIEAAKQTGASVAAFKAKDTIRKVSEGFSDELLDRTRLWQMQTPQCIKYSIAMRAFKLAESDNFYGTDDVGLVERIEEKVKIVECPYTNFKITTNQDLVMAESLLNPKTSKTGIGQDSHRFTDKEKPLVLAGITIPNHKGLEANSDGDVILHALFNAISSAMGNKSISNYCDKLCLEKGITDSKEYIKLALDMIKAYKLNNVSISIECSTPKIEPLVDKMKQSLSQLLNITQENIGITATSGEGLTDFGKGLGIQATVAVSLIP